MNTRISKILSVLATVAIVASSFVWTALPVAASTPGDGSFAIQDMPGTGTAGKFVILPGSEIIDIAVASDAKTIYVASNHTAGFALFKSTDAGESFENVTNNYITAALGAKPVAISVAPDDVNTVAVADMAGSVIITKDGGTTWSALPDPTIGVFLGSAITDIAVAPARTGTLLGREYVIALADPGAGLTAAGDVQIIGNTAGWATVGGIAAPNIIAGLFDFTSVMVTPNFLGDRCVVAVGTRVAALGGTTLLIINTATNTVVNNNGAGVMLLTTGNTSDFGNPAIGIMSSSIALPTNFDATSTSGRRAYVGIASSAGNNDNDVYRVDNDGAKQLSAVTSAPVYSVAYSGTVDAGILFMGPRNNTDVKYTTQMTSSSPTWTTTLKGPTVGPLVAMPSVVLRIASDYATSNKLFAGTMGLASGFNVSTDGAVSFVQESLIDTGATGTAGNPSLSFSSDAKSVLMSAKDANNFIAIWKSVVPFTVTTWQRLFAKPLVNIANSGSLKTSGTSIYFAETVTVNGPIYVSQDSGVSFSTRNGPSGVGIRNYALRDAQTVYLLDTTGNLYKSTNAAFFFGTAVSHGMGGSANLSLPRANQVIVYGTGVTISNDDGATFTAMTSGLPAGTTYTISADTGYSTNNTIYATDTAVAGANIFRVNTNSTSNTWENMGFPQGAGPTIRSLTTRAGLLYVTTNNLASGILRTLYPTDLIGNQNWKMVNSGLPAAPDAGVSTTVGINLYVRIGANVYAFNDFLATTKPTTTTPEDNLPNPVDPNTGNGMLVDFKIRPMGTGNGQVNMIDIEIADKNVGLTGQLFNTLPVSATNPVVTRGATSSGVPFQPNKSYLWRIRAAGVSSAQLIDSPWSETRTINVQSGGQVVQSQAGVILTGPQGGAQNINPALVGFSWAPLQGATEYQIIVAEDAALTKTVAGTPATVTTTSFQATGLKTGTTYFWAVKATKPNVSQQGVGTFTTATPVAPPATGPAATQPPITVVVPPAPPAETPAYIWAVIAIGAILVIAVIILIVRTRRVP